MAFVGTTLFVPSGADLEPYFAQMTNGANVQLLLQRGGTWTGNYLYRQAGGGPDNTHVIKAEPGTGALPIFTGQLQLGIAATPIDSLTLRELEFHGPGPLVAGSGTNLHLRRLVVSGGTQGIIVQADTGLRWSDVTLRRCRIMDLSNDTGSHVQGIYCFGVDGLRIVDCVVDNAVLPKDIFSHHVYIQNGCTGVVVRRNIFSRSSSHALQLRPGGEASNNLIIDCPIGILCGGGTDPESTGVVANLFDNFVLGGGDIDPDGDKLPRGWAYYLENIASGMMNANIAANALGGDPRGLTKDCSATGVEGDPEVGVLGVKGINFHQAHGTVHTDAGTSTGTTVSLTTCPITGVDLSFLALGLSYAAIRAGQINPVQVITTAKMFLGLLTPPKTDFWDGYLRRAGVLL